MESASVLLVLMGLMFALMVAGVSFYLATAVLQSQSEKIGVITASVVVPVLFAIVGHVFWQNMLYDLLFAFIGWALAVGISMVAVGAVTLPPGGARKRSAFCPDCGRALHAEWRACPYCGYEVWKAPQAVEVKIENLKRSAPAKKDTQDVAPPAQKGFYLLVKDGEDKGKVFALDKPVLGIGRDDENEIPLKDHFASGQHARIKVENEQVILYDLASTNGTRVNGKEIVKAELKEGDVVEIGRTQLTFKGKAS